MRRLTSLFFLAILVLLPTGSALAYSLSNPAPGFGPDQYQNLVSDSQYTSVDLDETAINQVFTKQGLWSDRTGSVSWLNGYQIPEYQTVPYKYNSGGTCVWSSVSVRQYNDAGAEALYGVTVASLINRKALQKSINPGVLLATLEKESSAITSAAPLSDAVEKWVLGYGWNDTMASCGYDQASAQQRAVDYGGIGQQIAYAMNFFLSKYNQYVTTYGDTFTSSDGATINAKGRGTRALYVYTPYVYNGNYNFWLIFHNWFLDGTRKFGREASLLKGSGPEIYAFWPAQNKRWYLPSMASANAWGIYNQAVNVIPDNSLQAIPLGTGSLTRLVKYANSPHVYYIEGDTKYYLVSDRIFPHYNLSWGELSIVDDILLDQAWSGHPIGSPVKSNTQDAVYIVTYNRKYYIQSEAILRLWGYTWVDLRTVSQREIDSYSTAGNINYLTQVEGSGRVYAVSDGQRLWVPSNDVLSNWGYNFGMVTPVGSEFAHALHEGKSLTRVVKGSGSDVYYISGGKKRYFSSEARLRTVGESLASLVQVSDTMLSRLSTGSRL